MVATQDKEVFDFLKSKGYGKYSIILKDNYECIFNKDSIFYRKYEEKNTSIEKRTIVGILDKESQIGEYVFELNVDDIRAIIPYNFVDIDNSKKLENRV